MAESRAGDMLIFFVIVFFVMTVILVGWDIATESVDYDAQNLSSYEILNRTSCTTPRYYVNGNGQEVGVISGSYRCDRTRGTVSQELCEDIEGCQWVNTTSWWWFSEESQKCEGTINVSAYQQNLTVSPFLRYNVCTLEDLQSDEEACYNLGCTFNKEAADNSDFSIDAVFESFASLFTLQYDFGFENQLWNAVFNFFAFYIWLIGIVLAGYYSLPFV